MSNHDPYSDHQFSEPGVWATILSSRINAGKSSGSQGKTRTRNST